jgi:hypothetical protein
MKITLFFSVFQNENITPCKCAVRFVILLLLLPCCLAAKNLKLNNLKEHTYS